ncbi:boophilin-G2-like isoform X3 [Thamnophis elegans]|uniref:boophilin-G2-like isoform X3 n=1 Tax=Thamnophis elegans TaxID=35005 RepID=UPI0013786FA6|nr:boophilin-G2-like isoform X3 [Thamnophis elegans]
MMSGRSPLLLLFLGVAFALWRPLLSFPTSISEIDCSSVPKYLPSCRVPREGFFYNVTTKSCERYTDFGCGTNRNSYESLTGCQEFCEEAGYCQEPPEEGSCNKKTYRWFYDPKTGECKTFAFGGCGGNRNNFINKWTCQVVCRHKGSP